MENRRDLASLKDHLFDTLEGLRSKENPMEIERAQAITNVSAQIINAAKVELQAINLLGGRKTMLADPAKTTQFFENRQLPPVKGLSTGKSLGTNGETHRA